MLRLFIAEHCSTHLQYKNMQPFEKDPQKLCVIQKTRGPAITLLKMLTEKNCGQKSVVAKTGIFSPYILTASARRKINIL